jgi:ketosteroid isomerase-like protein
MRRKSWFLAALIGVGGLTTMHGRFDAQDTAGGGAIPPALGAMAEAEREFARTARDKGIRDSFLEFFADDSIAFDPAPISAKDRLRKQESRPFAVRALVWEPRTGDVAASGELGWLTGPSTFIDHGGEDKRPRYGNYLSIWRLDKDRRWRVFIDVGSSLPEPAPFAPGFTRIPFGQRYAGKDTQQAAGASLLAADKQLNAQIASGGASRAYAQHLSSGSRLHRTGFVPMTTAAAIAEWLDRNAPGMTAMTGSAEASNAGDLGFSYGTYEVKGAQPESGAYVRVWSRDRAGKWFVMADVTQRTVTR